MADKRRQELTNKQKRIAENHYIKGMNKTEAARQAGYSLKGTSSIAEETLRKPELREYAVEMMKDKGIPEKALDSLEAVLDADPVRPATHADKLRAVDQVARTLGWDAPKTSARININAQFDNMSKGEKLARLEELKKRIELEGDDNAISTEGESME